MITAWVVAAIALGAMLSGRDKHAQMHPTTMADATRRWTTMADGSFTLMLNDQGGPRGTVEIRAPNWWMGMASHPLGRGMFTAQGMISLDPATVGRCGYAELLQVGETCGGRPLVDRQHPHDLLSQLALAWTVPVTDRTSVTIAGGPVGEPALGPVAYMHRPSAADIPVAPLSHHTFDSTHVAMGVATLAIARGPLTVEASVFNGREPDENRWNPVDRGAWDSWSSRVWYRPAPGWHVQASTGHLVAPEALEPGNIQRTTASIGWFRQREDGFAAIEAGYGRNDKASEALNAVFAEATHRRRGNEVYGRFEALQVETALRARETPAGQPSLPAQAVVAATVGVVRRLGQFRSLEIALGADLSIYRVPQVLVATHGAHPVSLHAFLVVRPPPVRRMWNMIMTGAGPSGPSLPHEEMPGMRMR